MVGGGQGRTPVLAKTIRSFLPADRLLSYLEAILRTYNLLGRRDNLYKSRIKILVDAVGPDEFTRLVETEWQQIPHDRIDLPEAEISRIRGFFARPPFETLPDTDPELARRRLADRGFARWLKANVAAHKQPGYAIVTLSLKPHGGVPGDATADQMDAIADLADRYSFGEIRVTHEQNLALVHVRKRDLYQLWQGLVSLGLATANIGLATDIIACPGLDYCSLANARSIPVAQRISLALQDSDRLTGIGELKIKISGCINACGHHHVGHIGILGVDKKGEEFYQITLGGSADETAAIGEIIGPAFSSDRVVWAVETIVETYLKLRRGPEERFLDAYRRVGPDPFKETLYATH
jgi:sulfite reductase (NADPH) hemoprotein beta-component